MRLVMTLLVRDEADIIDAQITFHRRSGVDFFVAMDNGSTDGTTERLEEHARAGHLHLIREPRDVSQEESVTFLARLAAAEFGADWVINSDADEFWWPRAGSLKSTLESVPRGFAKVHGDWCHFPPRPGEAVFLERLTARLCVAQPPRWHLHVKTAHRADEEVVVGGGNHDVHVRGGQAIAGKPIDVLHFPFRSSHQFERKYIRWCSLLGPESAPRHQEAWLAHRRGELGRLYASYVVSDRELRKGLRRGIYVVDTRLRDFLRDEPAAAPSIQRA